MTTRRWGRSLRQGTQVSIDLDADLSREPVVPPSQIKEESLSAAFCSKQVAGEKDLSLLNPCICVDSEDESDRPADTGKAVPTTLAGEVLDSGTAVSCTARRCVKIMPIVSLSFADAALAGQCRSRPFSLPEAKRLRTSAPIGESISRSATADGIVVWLRHFDIRLHDHPVFDYASRQSKPIYVLFPWSQQEDDRQADWKLRGTAAALWLFCALSDLQSSLKQKYGIRIIFRSCSSFADALVDIAKETKSSEVITSRAFDPMGMAADTAAKVNLAGAGIKFKTFNSLLLHDIDHVRVDMGTYRGHFGTLMPFYIACSSRPSPPQPTPEPARLQPPASGLQPRSESLEGLHLVDMPVRPDNSTVDWASQILNAWDISEEGALKVLRSFLKSDSGLQKYESHRQLADASSVARISPYLRFGMLSCRLMYHELKAAGGKNASVTFWRRLTWRDLAYWQLILFPGMREKPIRAHYEGQWWSKDESALKAWHKGETGYPLVDAGMRELWVTGWMAQNVRMVVAVFLCELLNIHWVEGEKWFHHTLVDADPAINAMMWQNAGKSGLDQWNFTMHPVTSGRRQDPSGNYVRRWCPELAGLPTKHIHAPWEAPAEVLRTAGVELGPGGSYPHRILVDVNKAAAGSMHAIREQRGKMLQYNDENGYDLIRIPTGATISHDGQLFRVFTKKDYRLDGRAAPSAPSGGKGYSAFSGGSSKGGGKSKSSEGRQGRAKGSSGGKSRKENAHDGFQRVMDDFMLKAGG